MQINDGHSIIISSNNNSLDKNVNPIMLLMKIHMAVDEAVAVVEGEDGVGTGVGMETTKVETTKKMAVIQTGAKVVGVDMETTKKMASIQTLAEVVGVDTETTKKMVNIQISAEVGVAEVGGTVVLGTTQVEAEV